MKFLCPMYNYPIFYVSKVKSVQKSSLLPLVAASLPRLIDRGPAQTVWCLLCSHQWGRRLRYLVPREGSGPEERSWVPNQDILNSGPPGSPLTLGMPTTLSCWGVRSLWSTRAFLRFELSLPLTSSPHLLTSAQINLAASVSLFKFWNPDSLLALTASPLLLSYLKVLTQVFSHHLPASCLLSLFAANSLAINPIEWSINKGHYKGLY